MSAVLLKDMLDAGRVRRFHTVPSHPHQTVAEHSWGVVMILLYIYPGATAEMVRYALTHDCGEAKTGDVPAHAKWGSRTLTETLADLEDQELERLGYAAPELTAMQHAAVKAADLLDLLLFSRRFAADPDLIVICSRVESYFRHHQLTLIDPFPRVKEFLREPATDRTERRRPSNSG